MGDWVKEGKDPNEPIRREEYEHRHAKLQSRYERFARKSMRILGVLVVVSLVGAATSAYLLHENNQRTADIKESLVEGCQQNGNPLRKTVRKFGGVLIAQTQLSIDQSIAFEKTGLLKEFLPNLPPEERHELAAKNRRQERMKKSELRSALKNTRPVGCKARYLAK